MVLTEVSQLSKECNTWRNELRRHREKLNQNKMKLRVLSGKQTNPDVLTEIEHLDNQFHIQLINIHDLKQSIKIHDRQILEEREVLEGLVTDARVRYHENLFDDYQRLESTLHGIRQEFEFFVRQL
ncbi:MAG TPA: hypothetical protein VK616_16120 [Flavitalea sp.]|nr:hypothetical protein [Flavitalea sp.]